MRARFDRMSPPSDLPGDLEERFKAGEIPLVSSTRSGRPPQMFPGVSVYCDPEDPFDPALPCPVLPTRSP
jgi:hypothetical protein